MVQIKHGLEVSRGSLYIISHVSRIPFSPRTFSHPPQRPSSLDLDQELHQAKERLRRIEAERLALREGGVVPPGVGRSHSLGEREERAGGYYGAGDPSAPSSSSSRVSTGITQTAYVPCFLRHCTPPSPSHNLNPFLPGMMLYPYSITCKVSLTLSQHHQAVPVSFVESLTLPSQRH